MNGGTDTLYELLPAFLRNRDWYEGQPLRALMAVLDGQYQALSEDIDGLYDNWFVETCEARLLPLIGELVGVSVPADDADWPGYRALVANALAYRQLKGTPQVLAKVAADATGWPCDIRPGPDTLSTTRTLRAPDRDRGCYVDVRRAARAKRSVAPVQPFRHHCQISGPRQDLPLRVRADRQSPDTIAICARRLNRYSLQGRTPRKIQLGCYTFHPLGFDQALHRPGSEFDGNLHQAMPWHYLPAPLTRAAVSAAFEGLRADADDAGHRKVANAFALRLSEDGAPVDPRCMAVADLSSWPRPAADECVQIRNPDGDTESVPLQVLVDPELGRFATCPGLERHLDLSVDYCHAFGGEIGAGPYPRSTPPSEQEPLPDATRGATDEPATANWFESINDALRDWPSNRPGVIRLAGSRTFGGWPGLEQTIAMPPGSRLRIEAADQAVPCFIGDLVIDVSGAGPPPELVLDGVLLGGCIRASKAVALTLQHCTVASVGSAQGPAISCTDPHSSVQLAASVLGPVRMHRDARLKVSNSIVGAGTGAAIAGALEDEPGPVLHIERSTVLGTVRVSSLDVARDSLFRDSVMVENRDTGGVEHCFLPGVSETPRRTGCQPDMALAQAGSGVTRSELVARIRPGFMSLDPDHAHFAQLSPRTPVAITRCASNGSEPGAFNSRGGAAREERLRRVLDEYLPWGLKPFMVYLD